MTYQNRVISSLLGLVSFFLIQPTTLIAQSNPTPHQLIQGSFVFNGFADGTTTTYPVSIQGHSFSAERTTSNFTENATADRVLVANSGGITTGSIRNEVGNGISLLNSGSNHIGAIVVAINTEGVTNVKVSWIAEQLTSGGNGETDRINGLALQYRIGTSGSFTTVPGTEYLTTNTANLNAEQSFENILLPAEVDGNTVVHIRWVYYISSGTANSRDRIRLDNINIAADGPTITSPSPTSLVGFTTSDGIPSSSQTFTISGVSLTSNLVVTAPTNFEVREQNVGDFGSSVSFAPASGTVSEKTIEVRIAATAPVGEVTGDVTISSTGATSRTVSLSGIVNVGSSPFIQVSSESLSNFGLTTVGSSSSAASFTVEGLNLTSDVLVTAPTGFQVSLLENSGFGETVNLDRDGTTLLGEPVTVFVRFTPQTASGAVTGNVQLTATDATTQNVAVSGTALAQAATTQVTDLTFTNVGAGTLSLEWVNGNGNKTIVLARQSNAVNADPVNGTSYTANSTFLSGSEIGSGNYVVYIGAGDEVTVSGLSSLSTYHFAAFTFTEGTGTSQNYLITDPARNSETTNVATYTWNVASGAYSTAASWSPTRSNPSSNDVLVFDGSTQASPTVTLDFSSPLSIAKIRLINNASVSFTSGAVRTLNIGTGQEGADFVIESGSSLSVTGLSAITLFMIAGNTAEINGELSFTSAAHKFDAASEGAILFNNGSKFIAGTGLTGNPFTNSGQANAVLFKSGSTYEFFAGANPFGLASPASKIVFEQGSTYLSKSTATPALSGRTYANIVIDNASANWQNTGGSLTAQSITVLNGQAEINLTGSINISGNLSASEGATLRFMPASANTLTFNGTTAQEISGAGTIEFGTNVSFNVDNEAGLTLNKPVQLASGLTLTKGVLTTNNNLTFLSTSETNSAAIRSGGTGSISGNYTVQRFMTASPGDASGAWVMLASPVNTPLRDGASNAALLSNVWTQGEGTVGGNVSFGGANVYTFNQNNSASSSAQLVTGWTPVTNYGSVVTPGSGYLMYMYTDDVYNTPGQWPKTLSVTSSNFNNFENNTSNSATLPLSFNSNIVEDVELGGWNLVGNPFISTIDWDAANPESDFAWQRSNVDNAIYTYRRNGTLSSYVSGVGANGGTRFIAPFQAFLVKANGVDPAINVKSHAKVTTQGTFLKDVVIPQLRLELITANDVYETVFTVREEGSASVDVYDAWFKTPITYPYAVMYSIAETGVPLTINNIANTESEVIRFPLHIASTEAQSAIIRVADVNLPEGWSAVLVNSANGSREMLDANNEVVITMNDKGIAEPISHFELQILPAGTTTSVQTGGVDVPLVTELYGNYPNPFNPTTRIQYALPFASHVRLEVFDLMGRRVALLVDGEQRAGSQFVNFDGASLSSGVYVYRLTAAGQTITRKMTLVK
jgi:hypothetical protein